MTDLSAFPVAKRWPAEHPDRLQLYSLPTPNGVKVSIMLEETGLPYEVHLVDFGKGDQRTPEYLSLNPYGKIPAIIDPAGPGGKPLPLFESGAILLYLAEKTGKFMPTDPAARYETLEWLFFQIAAMGPIFGQVGYFHKFAGREIEDKRPLHRYPRPTGLHNHGSEWTITGPAVALGCPITNGPRLSSMKASARRFDSWASATVLKTLIAVTVSSGA